MLYFLVGTASVLALNALGRFIAAPAQPLNRFLAACYLSLSGVFFYFWADYAGFLRRLPFLWHLDVSLTFFSAPSIYLTLITLLWEGRDTPRKAMRHFAFPIVFAVGFGLYNSFMASEQALASSPSASHFGSREITCLSLLSDCYIFAYIVATLIEALSLRARGRVTRRREYRIFLGFLGALLAASMLMPYAYIPREDSIFVAASFAFGAICVAYTLVAERLYNQSHGSLPPLGKGRKSIRTRWDSDAAGLDARLRFLMDEEEAYTIAALSLEDLAGRLRVSPARLSYHLNVRYGKNFKTYLNDRRISRACADLVDYPDRSILDVALSAGFNSKSNFNATFVRTLGRTPREFRKGMAGNTSSDR